MPAITLKVEQLVLDNDNPRITHADSQQQTLQKVVRDQKTKLIKLAESIAERGLSPIERLMVIEVSKSPKRYIALEGNRRVAALKLLTNPAVMTGLDMPNGMQRTIEKLAKVFEKGKVEPIDAFEVASRDDGRYWIELRHNGEDQGRGVVGWKPVVAARWRKKEPAIQALEMVLEHGGFGEEEAEEISTNLSLTTLRRFMESKDVRALLGLSVKDGQLLTTLPGNETIKPLRKLVTDIANKDVDSRRYNKAERMVEYIRGLGKSDRPDLSKAGAERPISGIQKSEFSTPIKKSRKRKTPNPSERKQVVPRGCPINVTDNRIAEIYQELYDLKMENARNAVAVLLRVFLELSIDHFLEQNNVPLDIPKPSGGGTFFKSLDQKVKETIDILEKVGVPRSRFNAVTRALSVKSSPLYIDLLHSYLHDRFSTPSPKELTAAWNAAQPLFEKIWPE